MAEFRLDENQLEVLGRLARSMLLNSGFVVHVLVGDAGELLGPAVVHAAYRSLSTVGEGLELRRFDHEHLDAFIAALDGALTKRERKRQLYIAELSALPPAAEDRARDLFTRLNARRDTLATGLRGELVLCVPNWLEAPMLAAGPDLASAARVWLLPRTQAAPGALERWRDHCDKRFEALLSSTAGAPARYEHGTFTFAYCFEPGAVGLSLPELRERLAAVPGYTGWRPWWVPTNKHVPRPHAGELECWMFGAEQLFPDPAHSDFWRASPRGCLYLRRGYEEDSSDTHAAGQVFSNSLPIWRTAEVLLHVADFAHELGLGGHRRATLEARWDGLRGRELSSWPDKPAQRLGEWTSEASASAQLSFELAELPEDLEALVAGLVGPLYEQFSRGARPEPDFVAAHIRRLLARRVP